MKTAILAMSLLAAFLSCSGAQEETTVAAALRQLSLQVASEVEQEQLRMMLSQLMRAEIAAANRASSVAWSQITSREAWEEFRREKLAALRKSDRKSTRLNSSHRT